MIRRHRKDSDQDNDIIPDLIEEVSLKLPISMGDPVRLPQEKKRRLSLKSWTSNKKKLKNPKTYGRKTHKRVWKDESMNTMFINNEYSATHSQGIDNSSVNITPEALYETGEVTAPIIRHHRQQDMAQEINPRISRVWWTDTRRALSPEEGSCIAAFVSPHEEHTIIRQRTTVDEATANNDKAEKIFEAERMRLYCELHHLRQQELAQHNSSSASSEFVKASVKTRLLKKKIEIKLNGLQVLFKDREREWWKYYNSFGSLTTEEKEQMRVIKYEEIRNPNYTRVGMNTKHSTQCWRLDECLYCDDDACEGC